MIFISFVNVYKSCANHGENMSKCLTRQNMVKMVCPTDFILSTYHTECTLCANSACASANTKLDWELAYIMFNLGHEF